MPSVRAVASAVEKSNGDPSEVVPSRVIFARSNDDGFKDDKGRSKLADPLFAHELMFQISGRCHASCQTYRSRTHVTGLIVPSLA